MNVRFLLIIAFVLIGFTTGFAQSDWYSKQWNWSEGKLALEVDKILNPTKILYIAAHPDDENTRLISWLVNDVHAEVAYLTMTNGGGGQNLIGEEIGDELGLIREQELYGARRIDGGQQFFTSATDFGYSKSHEETFEKWGKEKTLEEVVFRIRAFKPDIIITRFSPETEGLRSTHGHHTASAVLALEAFEAAADPERFPEQLSQLETWKSKAIYWNTSYWSYGSREKLDSVVNANPTEFVKLNVESYVDELGMTCSEIAATSRSMHKSQGFGSKARYGAQYEYLELLSGDSKASGMLSIHYRMLDSYFYRDLEKSKYSEEKSALIFDGMNQAYLDKQINEEQYQSLKELWLKSMGIRLFLTAEDQFLLSGDRNLKLEILHFGSNNVSIDNIVIEGITHELGEIAIPGITTSVDISHAFSKVFTIIHAQLSIQGVKLELPLIYRSSDPVKGEVIRPVLIVPKIQIELANQELIVVNSSSTLISGEFVVLEDSEHPILLQSIDDKGIIEFIGEYKNLKEGARVPFKVQTSANQINFELTYSEGTVNQCVKTIEYEHLPVIYKTSPASVNIHYVNVVNHAKKVAYIMGAGDKVPEAIEQMGAEVILIDPASIGSYELSVFDAVVFGIRVLNTVEGIDQYLPKFHEYAKNGGTLIMQYNTAHRLKTQTFMPEGYEIKLSRGRVTEENSAVLFPQQDPVCLSPNRLDNATWENWVQERGLYFPSEWSSNYRAPLGMHDRSEETLTGALLVANYGEGHLVYTGISFFRELPAGVEGAYQLFANLLSL